MLLGLWNKFLRSVREAAAAKMLVTREELDVLFVWDDFCWSVREVAAAKMLADQVGGLLVKDTWRQNVLFVG